MTTLLQLVYVTAAAAVIAGGVAGCLFLMEILAYLRGKLLSILRGEQ